MGIFGALMVQDGIASNLEIRTKSIALAVDSRLAMGLEVDEDSLDRWVWEDPDLPLHIVVVTQYGVTTTICSGRSGSSHTHRSRDRKSTRLNSSHDSLSYAVFGVKK